MTIHPTSRRRLPSSPELGENLINNGTHTALAQTVAGAFGSSAGTSLSCHLHHRSDDDAAGDDGIWVNDWISRSAGAFAAADRCWGTPGPAEWIDWDRASSK